MGQVRGEAQGADEDLEKFLKDVDNGPRMAQVVKLEKSEVEVKDGEGSFEIK